MKALSPQPNSLRVALAASTPAVQHLGTLTDWQLFGLTPLAYSPSPLPAARAYRTNRAGRTSRGRSTTTANGARFWQVWGLAGMTSRPG